jgi:ribosomal-protein-serine acetyltransferase
MSLPCTLATFPPLAIGEDLVLRAVELEEAEALAAFVLVNRAHLATFLIDLVEEITDVSTARAHLERVIALRAQGSLLELHIHASDGLCGAVRLRNLDWRHRSGNIGYLVGAAYQGRGIVTRAVTRCIEWAFDELQLHRVELRCAADNTASAAVARRLGFTLEGRLRDGECLDGRYHDILVFSRLRTDPAEPSASRR